MKMLLQRYNDNKEYNWGYNICDEDQIIANKYGIKDYQRENESRERFFERISDKPAPNEYGHNEELDYSIVNCNSIPEDDEFSGYAENKLHSLKTFQLNFRNLFNV